MRGYAIVFLIVGVMVTLVVIGLATASVAMTVPSPKPMLWVEQVGTSAARLFGTLIAVVAGLGLLIRGLYGDKLDSALTLVAALLAGLLILSAHWAVAFALGAVGVAALLRGLCMRPPPVSSMSDNSPTAPMDSNRP